MFIGLLQDLSDIVLIYTSGSVDLRRSGRPSWSQTTFNAPLASALPISAWGEDLSGQLDGKGLSQLHQAGKNVKTIQRWVSQAPHLLHLIRAATKTCSVDPVWGFLRFFRFNCWK